MTEYHDPTVAHKTEEEIEEACASTGASLEAMFHAQNALHDLPPESDEPTPNAKPLIVADAIAKSVKP